MIDEEIRNSIVRDWVEVESASLKTLIHITTICTFALLSRYHVSTGTQTTNTKRLEEDY